MTKENFVPSKEQELILKKMEDGSSNMLITGYPGTGKSELLKYFISTTNRKVVVLGSTGVAALNVGGQTIHSLFGLEPTIQVIDKIKNSKVPSKLEPVLNNVDTIVIDEVSMVTPDIIDAIDIICKKVRNSNVSFGGIQLICFGDLYQLPPVIKEKVARDYLISQYGGVLFYHAHAFENDNFIDDNSLKIYELTHIFRQKDEKFKDILNEVRVGNTSKELLDVLNKRVTSEELSDDVITIASTNSIVNSINSSKLAKLPGKEYVYNAKIDGDLPASYHPTDKELHLKVGAEVMMVNNDTEKRWANGSRGIITNLGKNTIKVKIKGMEYAVDKYKWKNQKYSVLNGELVQEEIGSFEQYPIKLAWATTIHKAQGQTYESVMIDLGNGAFATGQTYVALSRCVSLDTLYLKHPLKGSDILVSQEVLDFTNNYKFENLENLGEND